MKNRFPVLIVLFLICFSIPAGAGESPYSLSLAGGFNPFISGDAGQGDGAPTYSDAFGCGLSMNAEVSFRLNPAISLLGGIGLIRHSGDTHQDIAFSDLDIVPVYIGVKYHFNSAPEGWSPYVRADLGMARFDSVKVSYLGANTRYWNSSWEWVVDAGAGMEYRMKSMGCFLEIKARYMDNPSPALEGFSRADASWSMPVIIGITVYF